MTTQSYCDGISRRDSLRIGALGALGLSLSGYLRLASGGQIDQRATAKAAIFVQLPGGPSHLDTFDPKPEAPAEIRGKFQPRETCVSGIRVCEHLPRLAEVADRFAIVRGVSHTLGAHPLGQQFVFTGNRPAPSFEYPAIGSVVSHEMPSHPDLPGYVAIPEDARGPGHLGVTWSPLSTGVRPRFGQPFNVRGIRLAGNIPLEEIRRRQQLLEKLDRRLDSIAGEDALLSGLDRFGQKAHDLITSPRTREAFDISREPDSIQSLFGEDDLSQSCLLASRLVESGVRFVTVNFGGWDTHADNFNRLQNNLLPRLDAGLSGLFRALEAKGLLESTAVLVSGEFGRTPRINDRSSDGGRDHYPRCMFMLLGGGGIHGGQVVGESDDQAAGPRHELIKPEDVAASFFHALGIDHRKEFHTSVGRPVAIVREGTVLPRLFTG